MGNLIKHPVRLSVEEAYQSTFEPTIIGKATKRRTGSRKIAYGDGKGHEISEGQLLNQMRDALSTTDQKKVGLEVADENGQLYVSMKDSAKLDKVKYSRDSEGIPTIVLV